MPATGESWRPWQDAQASVAEAVVPAHFVTRTVHADGSAAMLQSCTLSSQLRSPQGSVHRTFEDMRAKKFVVEVCRSRHQTEGHGLRTQCIAELLCAPIVCLTPPALSTTFDLC
jgi:hypothetical protein